MKTAKFIQFALSSFFYIFFLLMLETNNFLDPTSLSCSKKREWDRNR